MGCCRKIRIHSTTRSVLCRQWVNPIRIIGLISLAIHIGVILFIQKDHSITTSFAAFTHLIVVFLLLRECQISAKYHAYLQKKTNH